MIAYPFKKSVSINYLDEDENDLFWELSVDEGLFTIREGKYGKRGKVVEKHPYETQAEVRFEAERYIFRRMQPTITRQTALNAAHATARGRRQPERFDVNVAGGVTGEWSLCAPINDQLGVHIGRILSLHNGDELVLLYAYSESDGIYQLKGSKGFKFESLADGSPAELFDFIDDKRWSELLPDERARHLIKGLELELVAKDGRGLGRLLTYDDDAAKVTLADVIKDW